MSGTSWTNSPVTLYHGTLLSAAKELIKNPINLSKCRDRSDFSQGFYTTTSRIQAVTFANKKYDLTRKPNPRFVNAAALLSWAVDRNALGTADNLVFVRADEDYWRFVSSCRNGAKRHKMTGYYDLVYGPVNLSLDRRRILPNSDQVSFHTAKAIDILQNSKMIYQIGSPHLEI